MKKEESLQFDSYNIQLKKSIKSQTTIFIILAIIIVVGIILFFTLKSSSDKENKGREYFEKQGLTPSINNIQEFIIECHKNMAKEGLIKIGIQGGYYNKPLNYYDMDWAFIPYYYDKGAINHPSKEKIESELSDYMNSNLEICIQKINFKNFEIKYEPSSTMTKIEPSETTFITNLPLLIEHKENKINFNLEDHPLSINSSLYDIIKLSYYITDSHKENSELMCINCITEIAKEKKLYVDFISFEKDTTLVMILENRTMEHPYIFEFLNKYEAKKSVKL
jgi:flagellar basal body-associated protein FliL